MSNKTDNTFLDDGYNYQQDSTTTARLEDIKDTLVQPTTQNLEAQKDFLMSKSTEAGIKKTVDAMCHVAGVLDTIPVESKSKVLSFSMEFCNDYGVTKDSVEVVLSHKKSEDERKELFVEVSGILVKTITYDTEMIYATEASAAVSGAILEAGGAAHPAGWVMAGVTGGSVYALGHVVATATSENAAKHMKEVAGKVWDKYHDKIEKGDNDSTQSTEQLPQGQLDLHLNQKESDIFNKETLEDIAHTLPKDVGLTIETQDNTKLEITVGKIATEGKEAKIFDSKVFNTETSTKEVQTWITGVTSMGVDRVEVNDKSFEIKDANATVVKENLANIPESSVLLSHVNIYPEDQLKIDENKIHTVVSGDTFSEIAQTNQMSSKALLTENEWLIDEGRIEFQEEKILVDTTEKENQIEVGRSNILNDKNIVSGTGVEIIREYDISKEIEQSYELDTSLKAQEIVNDMNLPQQDNSMDYGMEID